MDCSFFIAWMICFESIQNIICSKIDQELSNKQEQSEIKESETCTHSEQIIPNNGGFPIEPKIIKEAQPILRKMKNSLERKINHGKYDGFLLFACLDIYFIISDLLTHFRKQVLEYCASPTICDFGSVMVPENLIKSPIFTLDKRIENLHFLKLIQFYLNSDHLIKFITKAASSHGKNAIKMFLKLCNKKWGEIHDMAELEHTFQREIRGVFINLSFDKTIECNFLEGNVFMDHLYRELLELVCFKYNTQQRIGMGTYNNETHYVLAIFPLDTVQTTESHNILNLGMDESMIPQGYPKIIIISGDNNKVETLRTKTLNVCGKKYNSRNMRIMIKVQVQQTDHGLQIAKLRRNNDKNTYKRDDQNMSTRDLSYIMFEEQESR